MSIKLIMQDSFKMLMEYINKILGVEDIIRLWLELIMEDNKSLVVTIMRDIKSFQEQIHNN